MKRLLLTGCVLALGACTAEPPAPARTQPDPTALRYASWNDPTSVEQLLALEKDPEAGDVPAMVDEILRSALEGVPGDADDKTRMLHLVWYIHTHFVSGTPEPSYTTRRAIEQRTAECGGSSIVLQLAARRLGFATRGVGFFGVPIQVGHTAVEVYWGDGWHYLDPSFGAFFTDDGTLGGDILDIETVLRHRDVSSANAFYPNAEGRLGKDYTAAKPATLAEMFHKRQTDMPWSGDYVLFLPNTLAATVYGPASLLETRYAFEVTQASIRIGEADGGIDDVLRTVGAAGHPVGSSLYFVGDLSSTHGILYGELSFVLQGLTPGRRLSWTAELVSGAAEKLDVEVRKAKVLSLVRDGKRVHVTAEALRDEAEITLTTARTERILFDFHHFTAD